VSRVAVIGAGLTGLAAGWELVRAGVETFVLESEQRAGGVIVTERRDGYIVEGGPDGFLAAEMDLPELAAELGIEHKLVSQLAKGSSLWTGVCLDPLEEGRAATLLGIQEPLQEDLSKGFKSFAGGMADLVEALAERLGSRVALATSVAGLSRTSRGYRLSLAGGNTLEVDGVVAAVPAWVTAHLLAELGVSAARELEDVLYYPSLTVSLAYRAEQVTTELTGTGFVVSSTAEGLGLRACTYASLKYPGRSPKGHLLFRAFLAPASDDPPTVAHAELARILGINGAPLWHRVFHWVRGLPRYRPQHAARVAEIRERLSRMAPLAISGAGIDRAGVSACVRSGRAAGRIVLERL